MRALSRLVPALLLVAGSACRPAPSRGPLSVLAAQPPQPVSLLRITRRPGKPVLYRFPGLTSSSWSARDALPAASRILGADLDERTVYILDPKGSVTALDLETGRGQPVLTGVRDAVVGPDGTLYAVTAADSVIEISDRTPIAFPTPLPAPPRALYGTGDESVIAFIGGSAPQVTVADRQQLSPPLPIPVGEAAATEWANLIAIAADTAVVLYTPGSSHPFRYLHPGDHARHVAFSPSGHRLYIAREGEHALDVYDRFTWNRLPGIDLPGQPGDIRADPLGRYLLIRPATGDSVWVYDASTDELLGSWPTTWAGDLPTVAASRYLLLRQGPDLVSYDLATARLPEAGRIAAGATDHWLVLPWAPRGEELAGPATDSAALAAADTGTTLQIFVQLSSSQNPAWADELARKMKGAGLPAQVIKPTHPDEGYRVVLGPYPTREAAESTGKKLGQPYFIYTPDAPGP